MSDTIVVADRSEHIAFSFEDDVVYHTYSAYARGTDVLRGMFQWLDRAPKGRNMGSLSLRPSRRVRHVSVASSSAVS